MSETIRIVGFTGNKRQDSYNKALLQSALSLLPAHTELEIISVDDLPTYTQSSQASASVLRFREKIQQADAVLLASPEYHGLLPNGLTNALAWTLADDNTSVLREKPMALIGVGRSNEAGLAHLRQILSEQQAALLPTPDLYLPASAQSDLAEMLTSAEIRQQLRTVLSSLVEQVRESRSVLVD